MTTNERTDKKDNKIEKMTNFLLALDRKKIPRGASGEMDCPICGGKGTVTYHRVAYNGHLSAGCSSCGIIRIRADGNGEDMMKKEMEVANHLCDMILRMTEQDLLKMPDLLKLTDFCLSVCKREKEIVEGMLNPEIGTLQ